MTGEDFRNTYTQEEIDSIRKVEGRRALFRKGIDIEPSFYKQGEYKTIMGFKKATTVDKEGTAVPMGQEIADLVPVLNDVLITPTSKEFLVVDRLNFKYQYDGQWFLAYDVIEIDRQKDTIVGVYSGFIRGATPWECLSQLDEDVDADTATLRKNRYRTAKDVQQQRKGKKSKGFGKRK